MEARAVNNLVKDRQTRGRGSESLDCFVSLTFDQNWIVLFDSCLFSGKDLIQYNDPLKCYS